MIAAIIQARMGSSRLPGKVMLDLMGEPDLWRVVERARKAAVDTVIVATTTNPEDDTIEEWCEKRGVQVYRGSSEDVIARYRGAAEKVRATIIVRITSDCPLIDPATINRCIEYFQKENVDYASNCSNGPRTFPRGLDVEVFSYDALVKADTEAKEKNDREHVTPYIWGNTNGTFAVAPALQASPEYKRDYRLTLDYPEDYELLNIVYRALFRGGTVDVLEAIKYLDAHPEIVALNAFRETDHQKRILAA